MDDNYKRKQENWRKSLATWKAKENKESNIPHQPIYSEPTNHKDEESTILTKFLIFLAFAIPAVILGYALYINYLPFGYEKTYTLTVDEKGVISPLSNDIYLTTPKGKKLLTLPNGVEGQVNLVIEPNVVLKDATINVSIEGEGVYIATPPDISSVGWDYDWDFTQGIPEVFNGTATYNEEEKCTRFDAYKEQTLSLPNSKDWFESGPMSIYVKWKPSLISPLVGNNQQIVGHYNWEVWQSTNSVQFRVGRMNDANGTFYSITHKIDDNFFNIEHEALAVYSPDIWGSGYVEFWVDDNLAGRTLIGTDKIYEDYNSENGFSMGWSSHNYGKNYYFDGCLYSTKIIDKVIIEEKTQGLLESINNTAIIPIIGNGNITSVRVMVSQ